MKKSTSLLLSICVSVSVASAETIEWTSGQLGGGWYTMAAGMSKIIEQNNKDIRLKIVPGGGTANPSKVQKGRSLLGFGLDSITFLAVNGKDIYKGKKHDKVALIAGGLSDIMFHAVRSKDSKYTNVGDLLKYGKDQKIGITKVGSSDEKIFSWIMKYYKTSYQDLKKRGFKVIHANYSEISSQYKDGLIDYTFMNLGMPGASVIDMLLSRDGIITSLPNDLMENLRKEWGYNKGNIPKNMYKGQDYIANTGNMSTILFASTSLSTNTVYNITKALCENQSQLGNIHGSMKNFTCENAVKNANIPVHAGAMKYYKEMGFIK